MEYYSTRDKIKEKDFANRIHMFFSSRAVMRIVNESSCIFKFQRSNTRSKTLTNYSLPYKLEELTKLHDRRVSVIANFQLSKLKVNDFHPDEFLKNFYLGFSRACLLLKESLHDQRKEFLQLAKKKHAKQLIKSRAQSRKNSFIGISECSSPTKIKKSKTIIMDENFDLSEQAKSTLPASSAKWKAKKDNVISDIIDNYFKKFRFYYQKFYEETIRKMDGLIDESYRKKLEKFYEYRDSMGEFELMRINSNEELIKSVADLMHSLKVDHEKDMSSIKYETETSLSILLRESQTQEICEDVSISRISNELMEELISIFK